MAPAALTDIDETAATGGQSVPGVDEQALDNSRHVRQTSHPFGDFCERVRDELELPNSQASREVVSAVVNKCARLVIVVEDEIEAQAKHIGEMVAKERKDQGDPQLWDTHAAKIAAHVLKLRLTDEAPVATLAREEAAA